MKQIEQMVANYISLKMRTQTALDQIIETVAESATPRTCDGEHAKIFDEETRPAIARAVEILISSAQKTTSKPLNIAVVEQHENAPREAKWQKIKNGFMMTVDGDNIGEIIRSGDSFIMNAKYKNQPWFTKFILDATSWVEAKRDLMMHHEKNTGETLCTDLDEEELKVAKGFGFGKSGCSVNPELMARKLASSANMKEGRPNKQKDFTTKL